MNDISISVDLNALSRPDRGSTDLDRDEPLHIATLSEQHALWVKDVHCALGVFPIRAKPGTTRTSPQMRSRIVIRIRVPAISARMKAMSSPRKVTGEPL